MEGLGVTTSESSSQAACLDTQNDINSVNIFDYTANFKNVFCLLR